MYSAEKAQINSFVKAGVKMDGDCRISWCLDSALVIIIGEASIAGEYGEVSFLNRSRRNCGKVL